MDYGVFHTFALSVNVYNFDRPFIVMDIILWIIAFVSRRLVEISPKTSWLPRKMLIDESSFILEDKENEQALGFCVRDSLTKARLNKVGYIIRPCCVSP